MARTNLPLTTLVPNSGIAAPAGTSVDVANGMNVLIPATSIPATPDMENMFLYVNNTFAGNKVVTIRAGVGGGLVVGPAFRATLGDMTYTVLASSAAYIGPLDPSRFAQLDGSLNIDFAAGTTGTIAAFIVPERF